MDDYQRGDFGRPRGAVRLMQQCVHPPWPRRHPVDGNPIKVDAGGAGIAFACNSIGPASAAVSLGPLKPLLFAVGQLFKLLAIVPPSVSSSCCHNRRFQVQRPWSARGSCYREGVLLLSDGM